MRLTARLYFLGLLVLLASCTRIKDLFNPPSPREVYAREIGKNSPELAAWKQVYEESFQDSLVMFLPYQETGLFLKGEFSLYSYEINLEKGEEFHLELMADSSEAMVFVDLYRQLSDSLSHYIPVKKNPPLDRRFQYDVEESATYKLIIQPALNVTSVFTVNAFVSPSYLFPVAGYGNSAIQSFFGDPRDLGKRKHEGVDIFARRGTPVVAATDGRIQYTGEKGLGGKQVWLRTDLFGGNSIYYAHLDSIKAYRTRRVTHGDTLGFVGNTGNARTTPPHLHFGIYTGTGAVDPMPFIYRRGRLDLPGKAEFPEKRHLFVRSSVANLRLGASLKGSKIGEARRGDVLLLMGETENWRHVKTVKNLEAYIHKSLIQ